MAAVNARLNRPERIRMAFKRYWILYLMIIPVARLLRHLFNYLPMVGPGDRLQGLPASPGAFLGSKWVRPEATSSSFFQSELRVADCIRNTLSISLSGADLRLSGARLSWRILLNEVQGRRTFRRPSRPSPTCRTSSPWSSWPATMLTRFRVHATASSTSCLERTRPRRGRLSAYDPNCFYPVYIASGILAGRRLGLDHLPVGARRHRPGPSTRPPTVDGAGRLSPPLARVTLPGHPAHDHHPADSCSVGGIMAGRQRERSSCCTAPPCTRRRTSSRPTSTAAAWSDGKYGLTRPPSA